MMRFWTLRLTIQDNTWSLPLPTVRHTPYLYTPVLAAPYPGTARVYSGAPPYNCLAKLEGHAGEISKVCPWSGYAHSDLD